MFKNQFLSFNNNLYVIKRLLKEEDRPVIDVWKEHLQADTVLKKDGILYFLQTVEDLESEPVVN